MLHVCISCRRSFQLPVITLLSDHSCASLERIYVTDSIYCMVVDINDVSKSLSVSVSRTMVI
jgi:hypothetical protein